MTVMGFGLKPSPPGHRVLYSAVTEKKAAVNHTDQQQHSHKSQETLFFTAGFEPFYFFFPGLIKPRCIFGEQPVRLRLTGDDCSDADLQTEKKTLLFASQTRAFH